LKYNEAIRAAWPKVSVGWVDAGRLIPYKENLENAFEDKPLAQLITADEAAEVEEVQILEAFEIVTQLIKTTYRSCKLTSFEADTDIIPSMRLFYEHFQCIGYDHGFYEKLVTKKTELERAR
jgi:hypothetical protein